MPLQGHIEDTRERYVRFFLAARDKRMAGDPNVVSEILISLNTDTLEYPYRYLRVDLLGKKVDGTAKAIAVVMDPAAAEVRSYSLGTATVDVHPFAWCSVNLVMSHEPVDMEKLESWMTRWLDIDDQVPAGPNGESLAIHSFSPLRREGSQWILHADFGTAPGSALLELIEFLSEQGVRRFAIQ